MGVDVKPQLNYPFKFIKADALHVADLVASTGGWWDGDFHAIHASPPCQAYTKAQKLRGNTHPDLIPILRQLLNETGLPYVIENVVGAPLENATMLCGQMFGLRTYRHRLFETNFPVPLLPHPKHVNKQAKMGRNAQPDEFIQVVGHYPQLAQARWAMGIDWMTRDEMKESIPPAYTGFIGSCLRQHLEERCTA